MLRQQTPQISPKWYDIDPRGFAFGIIPKGLVPMEIVVLTYLLKINPLSNRCGTFVGFKGKLTNGRK